MNAKNQEFEAVHADIQVLHNDLIDLIMYVISRQADKGKCNWVSTGIKVNNKW